MRTLSVRAALLTFAAFALAACAGYDPPGTTYVRTDGRITPPDQVAADRKVCSEADKPQHCMLEKGYFLVQDDKATEKQEELAAIAEKNRLEREAVVAAEKKRQAELRRAEARKKRHTKKPAQQPAGSRPSTNATPNAWGTSQTARTQTGNVAPWPQR
jgi:hypothetical protein